MLASLAKLGVQPGREIRVLSREPLGELLQVSVEGRSAALSKELSLLVLGESTA